MINKPLSEKVEKKIIINYSGGDIEGYDLPVKEVKQHINSCLKELKDKLCCKLVDCMEGCIENRKIIDKTFKKHFGELIE